jgi:D-sedoheptulose 7-phosphate isomerase
MKEKIVAQLQESARVKLACADVLSENLTQAVEAVVATFRAGGKLFIVGNGGSAADAQHIAAELIGRFKNQLNAFPAIALTTNASILTAIGNDSGYDGVFSHQIKALANHSADILLAISTSGNSRSILQAVETAKGKKMVVIGFSGEGGALQKMVDIAMAVPSQDTQRIQEAHITLGHIMCDLVQHEMSN